MSDSNRNMWRAGIDMIDGPLAAAGIRVNLPELSMTQLEVLQGYSADLVKNISNDARTKINNEITLGLIGEKKISDVMDAIGKNLDGPGVFGKIATRAEVITRTESARVNSAARQARMNDAVKNNNALDPPIPLLKEWVHSGKFHARRDHLLLDGVTVPVNENFPRRHPLPARSWVARVRGH